MLLLGLPGPPATLSQPAAHIRPEASVVLVKAYHGDGSWGKQGSGVVVAPGLVATNAHVVRGGFNPTVLQGSASWKVTQVRTDASHDLCLLTVPGLPLPSAEPGEDLPASGMVVFSVGYPAGQGPVRMAGHLLGNWHFGSSRLLQSDAVTQHGSSGGGLFDAQGRLLGLTTFIFTENSRLNFSVPLKWVQALAATSADTALGPLSSVELKPSDILSQLANDPANWPEWERSARAWSVDHPEDPDAWMALGLALDRMARRDALTGQGHPVPVMAEAVRCLERAAALRAAMQRPEAQGWTALGTA